jgi:hypothetical protein
MPSVKIKIAAIKVFCVDDFAHFGIVYFGPMMITMYINRQNRWEMASR